MMSLELISKISLVVALFCHSTWAALGDSETSIEKDRRHYSGAHALSVARPAFSVHTISSGNLTIQEYVSSQGVIFGISWKGMTHPDLTQLLGTYFEEFRSANQHTARVRGRRSLSTIQSPNIIVEKSGQMRAVQGRAYIPALLPKGVSADDIQ